MNEPTYLIKFCIENFSCSPKEISKMLGLEPSFSVAQGEVSKKSGKVAKRSSWNKTFEPDPIYVEKSIEHLLAELAKLKKVRLSEPDADFILLCVIHLYLDGDNPVLSLSKEIIKQLAENSIDLEYDYYVKDASDERRAPRD